jgi:O-antigen/teichoic acid export membrane protein
VVTTVVALGVSIIFIVGMGRGIAGMVEGTALSGCASLLLFMVAGMKEGRFSVNLTTGRALIKYGLPMIPSFLSLYILQQGSTLILKRYASLEAVGLYSIGANFGNALSLIVMAFSTAWVPFFLSFKEKQEEAKRLFQRITTYYVLGVGLVSLLFYLFARPVVILFTKPAFHEAYRVIGLTATAQALLGLFTLFLPGVYFAKEVQFTTAIQMLSAMLFVGVSLIVIPVWGVVGAGLSSVAGYLIMDLLLLLWNRRRRDRYILISYEWKRLSVFAVLYTVFVAIVLQENNLRPSVEFIINGTLFAAMLAVAYGVLYEEERRGIRCFFPKKPFALFGSRR